MSLMNLGEAQRLISKSIDDAEKDVVRVFVLEGAIISLYNMLAEMINILDTRDTTKPEATIAQLEPIIVEAHNIALNNIGKED